jgi:hypothetical protein
MEEGFTKLMDLLFVTQIIEHTISLAVAAAFILG